MGRFATMWAVSVQGVKSQPLWVLTRAAISCMDETGLLNWTDAKLAHACRLTVRSMETHIPFLAGLKLLARADCGFRVVGWVCSESFSEIFSEKKERTKERKEYGMDISGREAPLFVKNESHEHAELWNQAYQWTINLEWRFEHELDTRAEAALRHIGGPARIHALLKNPRDTVFARREFMAYLQSTAEEAKRETERTEVET